MNYKLFVNHVQQLAIIVILIVAQGVHGQESKPSTLTAYKTADKINIDGTLSEEAWHKSEHITNFTQRELNFGQPISEKTEVSVMYNKTTLYIGIWCFQNNVNKIVAKNMTRDYDFQSDDNFQIMISPYNDNRTGYLFVVNPNGARADAQIYGGEDGNSGWNGVWDATATITDKGWFAEVIIPFSTLQFNNDSILNWAINFERDIVSQNEQALWQGWSRDNSISSINKAGHLVGIKDIAYAKKFEFKPFGLVGWQKDTENKNTFIHKAGANLNISISPTLKLKLTSYTDFAQVEADRIPVNLSRFSVYYPEKRQFFLEGSDMYSYYLGEGNNAFYSREIGIEDGKQIPIIAGARLFGKIGRNNIGFLDIQQAELDSIPTNNNLVFRYKRDVGKQSYIGCVFTNKINHNKSNQVFGIDGAYQTSEFLKNKNLTVSAKLTTSTEDFTGQKDAVTYRISADYPNDLIDNFMAIGSMQKNFNPELGYVHRTNYDSYTWYFRISPRLFTKYGIKRMMFKPWGFTMYKTHSTGELESFSNETRPIGAVFKSGERFEVNLIQNYDRIDESFNLSDNDSIPIGKYMMYQYEVQFETYSSRRIWTALQYRWGEFYNGQITTIESELGVNINKHFNIRGDYSFNKVDLPGNSITTHEIASYLNYAFNTRLNFSVFGQYNSLDQIMIYNIRFHWIPKIGSDFYFVYNIGYIDPIKQIDYLKPQTMSAVTKLVYRIIF